MTGTTLAIIWIVGVVSLLAAGCVMYGSSKSDPEISEEENRSALSTWIFISIIWPIGLPLLAAGIFIYLFFKGFIKLGERIER